MSGTSRIKAVSVWPEYAWQIATGEKTLEIRSLRTHHRGPLLICATKQPRAQGDDGNDLPAGVALCVVDVIDCRPMEPADVRPACVGHHPGHFAWVLADPRRLPEPYPPVSGRQGLFSVPASILGTRMRQRLGLSS